VHLPALIVDLALIMAVAAVMTLIFRFLKQPVVLGYLLAGMIVGPYTPPFQLIKDLPSIKTLAELGVIFLMFTLGLEFSFRKLTKVGLTAFVTALSEISFFVIFGYLFGKMLGWNNMESIFLGCMLSISSTTIIIKALDELKLKKKKFSQIIFGVLIVEDLFAILMLVALSTIAKSSSFSIVSLSFSAIKLIFIVGCWFIVGYFLVPKLIRHTGKFGNAETLTIVSLGLCLSLVSFADYFEYSPALGAFIMGSILAETSLIHQIEERMEPIKDLFGAIFFVSIGILIDPSVIWNNAGTILALSVFTILGKLISTSGGALLSGESVKHSFQVGMGLAQIGEFSFIIGGLGVATGAISGDIYPIIVAVSLITTFTTPYLIKISGSAGDKVEDKIPYKIKELLARYSRWIEHIRTQFAQHEAIGQFVLRWVINGIIVTLIFLVARHFGPKYIKNFKIGVFILAFLTSLPFVWAMMFSHRKFIRENKTRLPHFISPLLTMILLVSLSALFFPLKIILPLSLILLLMLIGTTYKKLEASYTWFENTFLDSFQQPKKQELFFNHLSPWNVHLVNLKVDPDSQHVGRTLLGAKLRTQFGINIVAIKRGHRSIVAPGPNEVLFPADELVVLGSDEQIEKARPEIENPIHQVSPNYGDYELRHLMIEDIPYLAGKTIRQAGIRESYQLLIVGIERAGQRIINPDTDTVLINLDKLWLVGERANIENLINKGC
jgi:CPA2 family monovalent cation:H+ antiporter-2